MGSYDGAETAEILGLYVLSKLEKLIHQKHLGLYRDDGLAVVNLTGVEVERLRKQVFKLFKSLELKVTIEANITETDFLDLYLNLKDSIHTDRIGKTIIKSCISMLSQTIHKA